MEWNMMMMFIFIFEPDRTLICSENDFGLFKNARIVVSITTYYSSHTLPYLKGNLNQFQVEPSVFHTCIYPENNNLCVKNSVVHDRIIGVDNHQPCNHHNL